MTSDDELDALWRSGLQLRPRPVEHARANVARRFVRLQHRRVAIAVATAVPVLGAFGIAAAVVVQPGGTVDVKPTHSTVSTQVVPTTATASSTTTVVAHRTGGAAITPRHVASSDAAAALPGAAPGGTSGTPAPVAPTPGNAAAPSSRNGGGVSASPPAATSSPPAEPEAPAPPAAPSAALSLWLDGTGLHTSTSSIAAGTQTVSFEDRRVHAPGGVVAMAPGIQVPEHQLVTTTFTYGHSYYFWVLADGVQLVAPAVHVSLPGLAALAAPGPSQLTITLADGALTVSGREVANAPFWSGLSPTPNVPVDLPWTTVGSTYVTVHVLNPQRATHNLYFGTTRFRIRSSQLDATLHVQLNPNVPSGVVPVWCNDHPNEKLMLIVH